MHIAIVDEELPYPLNSGKRIRTTNLITRLAQRHRITYFCHRNEDSDEAEEAVKFFHKNNIETVVVERPLPPKSGLAFYVRLALNLFSPLPYSVAVHSSFSLRQAIAEYQKHHHVDLWQCEWTPYTEIFRRSSNGHLLVMAHNVESLIWQRYHEMESNFLKRWYIKKQWHKFETFEQWAFAKASRTVTVSSDDAALARQRFNAERVDVVDNGVDTTLFQPGNMSREPRTVLFLASLDWRPNLDAVNVLLDQIFPAVRSQEPDARLMIVGRKPPQWLLDRVRQEKNVELHADVPDVRPHLNRCAVMAVPLRIGGGSRLKILEALAAQTPVVSTEIGAEGLRLESGTHLSVVKNTEEMADALVHSMRNPEQSRAMAERGREIVLDLYDWDALSRKLEEIWVSCVSS